MQLARSLAVPEPGKWGCRWQRHGLEGGLGFILSREQPSPKPGWFLSKQWWHSRSRGCFVSVGKWEAFSRAVRAALFNSLKLLLLLLFSFYMNANTSAFLGGFINHPAHHSEPHNSCQVPTSLSYVHCRVWIPLTPSHDGKQVQGRIKKNIQNIIAIFLLPYGH